MMSNAEDCYKCGGKLNYVRDIKTSVFCICEKCFIKIVDSGDYIMDDEDT
jgi:hypothetical protein